MSLRAIYQDSNSQVQTIANKNIMSQMAMQVMKTMHKSSVCAHESQKREREII